MAQFNLSEYETVEERIKKFYADYPDGRIITRNLTTLQDRQVSTWVVEATLYLSALDQISNAPKATGLAFEIDGGKGANATSALENCETSAIGRALANANYSGDKRTSREEMAKVQRGITPPAAQARVLTEADQSALTAAIQSATTEDELRAIWNANKDVIDQVWLDDFGAPVSVKAYILIRKEQLAK